MSEPTLTAAQRRRFLRFPPDPLDTALIDFAVDQPFKPKYVGLIRQEAYAGCGLLMVYEEGLEKEFHSGRPCTIKVGKLDPLPAEVVWSSILDEEALKVGFKFVDS